MMSKTIERMQVGPPQETRAYTVGDVVEYLPHVCHAFNCNANNEYPWVIGLKKNPHYELNPQTGENEIVEDVVELDEGQLHRTVLPGIHHSPSPKEGRGKLVPLRPQRAWPARVIAVEPDGTVDLDIASNIGSGMITLHYRNVPIDESGSKPHTCRKGVK